MTSPSVGFESPPRHPSFGQAFHEVTLVKRDFAVLCASSPHRWIFVEMPTISGDEGWTLVTVRCEDLSLVALARWGDDSASVNGIVVLRSPGAIAAALWDAVCDQQFGVSG